MVHSGELSGRGHQGAGGGGVGEGFSLAKLLYLQIR